MDSVPLLDCAGRLRSPATTSSFHLGRPPRNKGRRYPADPPTVAEIIAVMRAAGDRPDGIRLRGVIVVLWRAGLRISEALALTETDLDRDRGSILVRRGKGGKRREVGMDRWGWEHLEPWLELRAGLPPGAAVLRTARTDPRTALHGGRGPQPTAHRRRRGRRATAVRSASAAPCARGRDVTRGRAVVGHPATARTCRSRDHLGVSARDRQRRDHPHRPRTLRADDSRDDRPAPNVLITTPARRRASARRRVTRPLTRPLVPPALNTRHRIVANAIVGRVRWADRSDRPPQPPPTRGRTEWSGACGLARLSRAGESGPRWRDGRLRRACVNAELAPANRAANLRVAGRVTD